MLRRFADRRLRAELDKARAALAKQIEETQEVAAELADARRTLRDAAWALETQTALTDRWRRIAEDLRDALNQEKQQ